jgi:MFS family permease
MSESERLTISTEQPKGIGAWPPFNPHHRLHRYVALFLICFLSFGSYFCYDNPAALASVIQKDMEVSNRQYMLLYSWYSWPNTVLCFFGGYLIDRVFGIRMGTLVFSSFCILGQAIFASAALLGPSGFWLMEVGRFVFGLGGESLAVAQNTYSVLWFKGTELNMVFGLQLSFSRVGSTVNMNVMNPIYDAFERSFPDNQDYTNLALSLYVGVFLCIYSFICGVILLFTDRRAARILKRSSSESGEVVKLTDVRYFPLSYWLITIICVTYYSAVFPFIGVGTIFFLGKFGMTDSSASLVDSIVYLISAGASPLFGFMVDATGRNLIYLLVAVIGTLLSHMLGVA